MVILGGGAFLVSEVPLYVHASSSALSGPHKASCHFLRECVPLLQRVQGYLTHKKTPTPLGPP